jgi:hypothetical protein
VSGSSEVDRSGGSRWLNDGKHGGAVVVKGWRRKKGCSTRGGPFIADGGGFGFFFNLSKIGSNLKIKMGALFYSKNSQCLHVTSL